MLFRKKGKKPAEKGKEKEKKRERKGGRRPFSKYKTQDIFICLKRHTTA